MHYGWVQATVHHCMHIDECQLMQPSMHMDGTWQCCITLVQAICRMHVDGSRVMNPHCMHMDGFQLMMPHCMHMDGSWVMMPHCMHMDGYRVTMPHCTATTPSPS